MSMASNDQQESATGSSGQQQQQPPHEDNSVQDTISEEDDLSKQRQIELEEEKKLRAKHPCIQRPGSEFLQKRLQRGQKYFDSGDYNMAKASTNSTIKLPDNATPVTAIDSKVLNKRH